MRRETFPSRTIIFSLLTIFFEVDRSGFFSTASIDCSVYKDEVMLRSTNISLDWKFQSSPSYTPRFAHATLQFLCSGDDGSLEWRMLFISVIISTLSVLMTTPGYRTACTQFELYLII